MITNLLGASGRWSFRDVELRGLAVLFPSLFERIYSRKYIQGDSALDD